MNKKENKMGYKHYRQINNLFYSMLLYIVLSFSA